MPPRFAHVLRAVSVALCLAAPLHAADRAAQFLDGLRERGWHDVALEYLETADQDPLATQEFLDGVDFQRATTLAAMAAQSVRESERLRLNERAIVFYQRYAAAHSDSPQRLQAMSQAGNLLSQQALASLAQADRLPAEARTQRDALREEARQMFDSASDIVEQLLAACEHALDADPDDRQRLIAAQAEARLLAANLLFNRADTFEIGSSNHVATLEAAAKSFAQLHEEYRDKLVGFYGRLYEGRSYQATGKWEEALQCYADLVEQPISAPDFRRIVARAYRHRAECHLAQDNPDEAIDECREWLSDARGDELEQPEWVAVAYRLAEAYQQKAADAAPGDADKFHAKARQWLRDVAVQPGEFQAAARTALAAGNVETITPKDVKTFAEAFSAARQALERMNSAKLAARLAETNNPDSVDNLRQQAARNQAEAKRLLETALKLADEDEKLDDVLATRHYLCWIYWEEGRIPEAAVLGEFLAQHYPESSYAASAAKVALASWERLYLEAKQAGDDGSYETENLGSLAELIARLWPESPEAGTAVNLLMQIALGDGRLADAERLLDQLPESSRAAAELTLGGTLWTQYLQQSTVDPDGAAKLQERAADLLSAGYAKLTESAAPTTAIATGVLYYVQQLLAHSDFDQAIAVLENPTFGPLAVVDGGSPDVQQAFVLETYKAALRAYLSVDPPQREKVQEIMAALEQAIGSNDDAQQQLTRVYLGLALELQEQIRELTNRGRSEQSQALAAALDDLLSQISDQDGSRDWKTRSWVAQTQLQLGTGLDGEEAEKHLAQAEQVYRSMLQGAEKDPGYAPNQLAVLGVRKQMGDCLRAQNKFDAAFEQYVAVLREKPNMLDLQRETALVLQDWGQIEQNIEKLEEAIRGVVPQADKKNLVWGWLRLAAIANQAAGQAASGAGARESDQQKAEKFYDLFFEARYHVAQCRLQTALIATGAERPRLLDAARQNVESMQRLYPDLGGPKWRQRFVELLEQIEAVPAT